ncbi:hypothetical protein [Nitrobacter sp.]|uniref:hypothetical protein n=2 Tax=Nitrobacter sp. TaxID=29420 RepID=UPI0029CABF42|nr:hypothetical protein [Nitrobacter sp.]
MAINNIHERLRLVIDTPFSAIIATDTFAERNAGREDWLNGIAVSLERIRSLSVWSWRAFIMATRVESNQMPNEQTPDQKRDQKPDQQADTKKSEIRKAVEQDRIDPKNPQGQENTQYSGGS